MRIVSQRSRRRRWALLVVVGLVAGLLAAFAPVASGAASTNGTDASTGYLIVELTGSAAALDDSTKTNGRFDPASQGYARIHDRMERQHAKFIQDLSRVAPDATVVNEMFITANAVIVQLNGSDPAAVRKIRGVARTEGSTLYKPTLNDSVTLIHADDFWTANAGRDSAGVGVKVGVIDSGIDPGHPFFTQLDCLTTVHFGGIYYSGEGWLRGVGAPAVFGPDYTPTGPGDYLYFSSEHGTHVAGIIAGCVTEITDGSVWDDADTIVSGVAPGAALYDYNVFPAIGAGWVAYGGSAFSHDIGRAIEDAVADGMDVINMSLSGGVQGNHDFLAEVSNNAVAAGVVVVAAAGNEGDGDYTVGSPASGSEVIAVGASTNSHGFAIDVVQDPSGTPTTYPAAGGEFPNFDGTTHALAAWDGDDEFACGALPTGASDFTGETVLISRGACPFSEKVANAKAANAFGVIIVNNVSGDPVPMAKTDGYADDIPAVMVSDVAGAALLGAIPIDVAVSAPYISAQTPNLLADFSSRGPSPFSYAVKPDVVAPGVNILSSVFTPSFYGLVTVDSESWALFDGTSMASPHVAGEAAALLSVHPGWTPEMVKSALVSTADTTQPGESVFDQGGGLTDLFAADGAATWFYPANASFGLFTGNKPANASIDIAISGVGTDGTCSAFESYDYLTAGVSGSTLTISFEGGRDAESGFYGGYVDVTCSDGSYTIPWGAVVNRGGH